MPPGRRGPIGFLGACLPACALNRISLRLNISLRLKIFLRLNISLRLNRLSLLREQSLERNLLR
jgi:hypothetical protein